MIGVDPRANVSDIQSAFTNLVKVTHPDSRIYNVSMDKKEAVDRLQEAQDAWNVLRSRKRRAFYDSERRKMSVLHNQVFGGSLPLLSFAHLMSARRAISERN